jgi:hypothetical protein
VGSSSSAREAGLLNLSKLELVELARKLLADNEELLQSKFELRRRYIFMVPNAHVPRTF